MKTKLVVFGITGDLAQRKLLPALRKIMNSQSLENIELIGVSRHEIDIKKIVGEVLAPIAKSYTLDVTNPADYKQFKKDLGLKGDDQLVVYLSVPPLAATQIADGLGMAKLNTPNVKILFEKPFGVDYESAREMVKRTSRYFGEDQIYRIDHYLAKEMAQNIVAFRSGNAMLRHIWSRQSIERIEVLALEDIGVKGRAHFYEQVGALRDIVQGHLMQLLALILMDTPSKLDWDQLPSLRHQALARLLPADPKRTVRAQYVSYRDEVDNPISNVETFVATELYSNSSTWEDVPLRLITGKALNRKITEINIYFRASNVEQSNCLRFKIQPDEGVEIDLYTKKPGYDREFEMQKLLFKYPEETTLPEAYEQVIVDAVRSRKSLFTGSDEILESWRVLQPLLDAWAEETSSIQTYELGVDYRGITGDKS
jgi:glucose-6-phosphate 1-dehydrogenase